MQNENSFTLLFPANTIHILIFYIDRPMLKNKMLKFQNVLRRNVFQSG